MKQHRQQLQTQVNQTLRCGNRQRSGSSPSSSSGPAPAAGRPAPEDANMEPAESSAQPTSSVVRALEAEDGTSAQRQKLMAGMPTLHETDVDVNMDAHKLVVLAAVPDDQGKWTQRVIDWNNKYYGAKSGTLLDTRKVYEGRLRELVITEKLEVAEPIQLQEARVKSLEIVYGKVAGRCERDARGPRCGQEQIVCNTGKHVRPRGCDAGDTANQSVQNHCESSCNENKCEGTA